MSPKMTAKPVLIPLQTLSDVPKQPKASNPQGGFSISKIDLKRTRKSLLLKNECYSILLNFFFVLKKTGFVSRSLRDVYLNNCMRFGALNLQRRD